MLRLDWVKSKTLTRARSGSVVRRNDIPAPLPPKRSSELNLTPQEVALLADPNWVTEDEADLIICLRREKEGGSIPVEEVLAEYGFSLED